MQGGQMMQPQHNQGNIMGMMNPQHAGPNATSPHAAQHQQNHPHMMIPTNQVCSALGVANFGLITNHYSLSYSGNAAAWPGPATADPTPRWSNDDATESQHCRPARAVPASPATTSSATASNHRTSRLSHVPVKSASCSVC